MPDLNVFGQNVKLLRGIKMCLMYEYSSFYLNRKYWSNKGVNFSKLMYEL